MSEAAAIDKPPLKPYYMLRSLRYITEYAAQQSLIRREFTVDELFDDVTRALIPEDD
jgi:hypothetical protein